MKRRTSLSLLAVACFTAAPTLGNAAPQGAPPPAVAAPQPPTAPTPYQNDATKAWGEAPATAPDAGAAPQTPSPVAAPTSPTPTPADAEKAALKKKCDAAAKEGKSLPECKALELDIVFQGGMGAKAAPAPALPQASDTESNKLVEKKLAIDDKAQLVTDGRMDLWAVARRERPLLEETPSGFWALGLRVGYPFMVARGSGLKKGYEPIIHTSIEGSYQLHRFLQIAVVADFQALRGDSTEEHEYLPTDVGYEDGSTRPLRDIGSLLDNYFGVGVRPTVRLGAEWRSFQTSLGLGFGWHFLHTSGRWRAKLDPSDRANTDSLYGDAAWKGNDYAIYSFTENDSGAYTVFEFGLGYRFLDGRLGASLMLEYTILLHGRANPEVTVEKQYGLNDPLNNLAGWSGYTAEKDDYEETLVRHLGAMNFITLGAAADYRF